MHCTRCKQRRRARRAPHTAQRRAATSPSRPLQVQIGLARVLAAWTVFVLKHAIAMRKHQQTFAEVAAEVRPVRRPASGTGRGRRAVAPPAHAARVASGVRMLCGAGRAVS
jgi:hypothetical protein